MKKGKRLVNVGIGVVIISLIIIGIGVPNSHADEKITWQERLKQREQEFINMKLTVDIMYRMASEWYLPHFGQERYDNLIWSKEDKCLLCGREKILK